MHARQELWSNGLNLLGRPFSLYRAHWKELHRYPWYFLKCFRLFRRPLAVISAYLRMGPPPGRIVELRNGLKIFLSGHPHDIVTLFLVFVREDYGRVPPGGFVIDVGANIGIFSLYAVDCGAERVHAYEPVSGNFRLLLKNITENGLAASVEPHHAAVWSDDTSSLRFPREAGMYSTTISEGSGTGCEEVRTVSLDRIVEKVPDSRGDVDLLKMDCEGAEYEILAATRKESLGRVRRICLEYHRGKIDELVSSVSESGFQLTRVKPDSDVSGTAWFTRPDR